MWYQLFFKVFFIQKYNKILSKITKKNINLKLKKNLNFFKFFLKYKNKHVIDQLLEWGLRTKLALFSL
jgi:hypothetical protein